VLLTEGNVSANTLIFTPTVFNEHFSGILGYSLFSSVNIKEAMQAVICDSSCLLKILKTRI
jgi:hypothetical protein